MSVERELKFAVPEHEPVRRRVEELGGVELAPESLERNWVFDRGRELFDKSTLLRLRSDGHGARLTLKGPAHYEEGVKVREERELSLSDAREMGLILERIGFRVMVRYEKYRAEWRLDDHTITFDRTPMGLFIEVEGERSRDVSERLGLDPDSSDPRSYLALWAAYRQEHPDAPMEMLFS